MFDNHITRPLTCCFLKQPCPLLYVSLGPLRVIPGACPALSNVQMPASTAKLRAVQSEAQGPGPGCKQLFLDKLRADIKSVQKF